MLTDAHACARMLPHARPPAGRHAHTSSHIRTPLHICSHMCTRLHTCLHMCTHAFTCSHLLHMETRFPFPARTGLVPCSFLLCFAMVFTHFLNIKFCRLTKVAKPLGTVALFDMLRLCTVVLRVSSSFSFPQPCYFYSCLSQVKIEISLETVALVDDP